MGLRPPAICRRSARVGGGVTDERVGINNGDRCSLLVRNVHDGDDAHTTTTTTMGAVDFLLPLVASTYKLSVYIYLRIVSSTSITVC